MHRLKRPLILSLLLAIALRFILLFWTSTMEINGDQTRFEKWAQTAHVHSLDKTYIQEYVKGTIPNNQPPGTLYIAYGTYEVYILIGKVINKVTGDVPGSNQWINSQLLHMMMRIPSLFADIGIGLLLYLLVKKESDYKKGLFAANLVWFNPIVVYNSAVWGQMDSITTFLFVLSVFLALRKKYVFSILPFFTSLYIKLSILPLFPFFIVFLYFHSGKQWKKIVLGFFLSITVVLVATLPISGNPLMWLISKWRFALGEAQNITVAAFNFWHALTCLPTYCPNTLQSYDKFLGLPVGVYAYILFAVASLPLLTMQVKKHKQFIKPYFAFFVFSLIALSVFMLMPRMHDRYMYPFFVLFAPIIALAKNRKPYLALYCVLTILHFANLFASWRPYFAPQYQIDILYSNTFRWIISILTVITFIFLYKKSFKEFLSEKLIKRIENPHTRTL
jgi:Gpi18-like mannosyltransferase